MNQDAKGQPHSLIPPEMGRLLCALSDSKSIQVVATLLKKDRMRFGEIKAELGLNSSSLSAKLKKLQDGGLVTNFYAKGEDLGHSYYKATEISKRVFDSLFNILYAPNVAPLQCDIEANWQTKRINSFIFFGQDEPEMEMPPIRQSIDMLKRWTLDGGDVLESQHARNAMMWAGSSKTDDKGYAE